MFKQLPRTKIIATIGPSTWDKTVLSRMFDLGMYGARINASFADFHELKRVSALIKSISSSIALILDTQGHKIRLNKFEGAIELEKGNTVEIGCSKGKSELWIDLPGMGKCAKTGDRVLVDNGAFELVISKVEDNVMKCKVINGGMLTSAKTVNFPDANFKFPSLTEKDIRDIEYAVENKFDFISASFIESGKDVEMLKEYTLGSETKIIAKIESKKGVQNFDEILKEVDGVMVARGDLGVDVSLEKVPIFQKEMVRKCRETGKLVIVATQMIESMVENNIPTRAEVSDIANAVFDGADVLMLSSETSVGRYPVEATEWMSKICLEAENSSASQILFGQTSASAPTDSIARSVIDLTCELPINKIVVGTKSGNSVLSIARHRPAPEIIAFVNNETLGRQLNLVYGVRAVYVKDKFPSDRDWLVRVMAEYGIKFGYLKREDMVVLVTGSGIAGKSRNSILEVAKVFDICKV